MDWQITGHQRQLKFLENALVKGKLSHGYVFAGPEGVGKKTIVMKLARELLGEAGFQPDLIQIDGSEGIKIEQVRELIYKLSLKPYAGEYKVAVIDAADMMTTEAANALLKSLEEPKSNTFIFLITSNPNRLPKTILSRAQKITFGPVNLKTETNELDYMFKVFQTGQLTDKLVLAYEIAELETVEIKNLLNTWLQSLEKELLNNASKKLAQKISQVLNARKFLDQNVNSKLLLTSLMLNS